MGYQHWGQQLALFPAGPLVVDGGDTVVGVMHLLRHVHNYRMYNLLVDVVVDSNGSSSNRDSSDISGRGAGEEVDITAAGDSVTSASSSCSDSSSTSSSRRTGSLTFEVP
jgi:hypothetical protein